jgi:hypothetical protein
LLRISISDERSRPIPFRNIRLLSRPIDRNPPRSVAVKIGPQEDSAGVSRILVHLGAANLYLSEIELRATEPFYTRKVSVLAPRVRDTQIVEDQIASGEIHRINLEERITSENQKILIERQVLSESITLLIQNNDAPSLRLSEIEVRYRPYVTSLYVQETGTYVLATGNTQATAPQYEMNLVRSDLAKLKITEAPLGPLMPNPNYREPEALPGLGEKGVQVDLKPWKFRKQIRTSGPGIYQIQLDPETLSLATPDLQDLRVVQKDTQLPFLFERSGTAAELEPQWGPTNLPNRASVSAWFVVLPFEALPVSRLIARVESPLFQRTVSVYDLGGNGAEESERRFLGQSTWMHKPGQTNIYYSIELNAMPRSNRLLVETDNGDNPAISIQSLKITYPITRVLIKVPANPSLYLYFGNAEAHAPQYDLAMAGEQFIAVERKPGALGSLERLQRAGVNFSSTGTSTMFWAALVAVVAGLVFVVSRLLPRSPS